MNHSTSTSPLEIAVSESVPEPSKEEVAEVLENKKPPKKEKKSKVFNEQIEENSENIAKYAMREDLDLNYVTPRLIAMCMPIT